MPSSARGCTSRVWPADLRVGRYLAFAAFLAFVLVPSEERQLMERFDNEYLRYKNSVPRWVGNPRS